jgi:hypothetical protein
MSAGWQSKALHIDSSVLKRIAFAFPVFKMERFDNVKSTLSESSLREILRLAIITSKFTMIGII